MATRNGYLGNPSLKQISEQIQFTDFQLKEYIRCSNDPVYFLENYGKIVSLDDGIINFKLYDYQKEIIESIKTEKKTLSKLFRQSGKCVDAKTKYEIRNKLTGEVLHVTAEEFHKLTSQNDKPL